MSDPKKKIMIMGNHGILVVGDTVAETFNRLYYFERAAETYVRARQTGQSLRVMSDDLAEKTACEIEEYPHLAVSHLAEIKAILDDENSNYAS
jgi:ribulose-5-phosphate 4-epimerase/fuculose-1-phosphate aldolase